MAKKTKKKDIFNDLDLSPATKTVLRRIKKSVDATYGEAVTRQGKLLSRAQGFLRSLEWARLDEHDNATCSFCLGERPGRTKKAYYVGHYDDCKLNKLLNDIDAL